MSTFNEYPVPDLGHGVDLAGITAGPDGNVWFTDRKGDAVGRITPDGTITEFVQPSADLLQAIVGGADGNLWYGGQLGSLEEPQIGRITPDGAVTKFPIPNFGGDGEAVQALTVGPDGNVWYGQVMYAPEDAAVGSITPDGQGTSSMLPRDSVGRTASGGINSITTGPDGNIWFIPDYLDGHHYVGRVTPDGQYTLFETPGTDDELLSVTAGPDGNVWAPAVQFDPRTGQRLSASIDQITPDGQFTGFPLPDVSHRALSIALGPDGNLWFTEPDVNQIGMMTPDGQLTEYAIPTPNSNPQLITAGPDDNIWFTEAASGQIGELVLNDSGPAARAGSGKAAPLAQEVRAAAVDAVFSRAQADRLESAVVGPEPAPASAAATLIGGRVETASAAAPAQVNLGGLSHVHPNGQTLMHDIPGLTDPLAGAL